MTFGQNCLLTMSGMILSGACTVYSPLQLADVIGGNLGPPSAFPTGTPSPVPTLRKQRSADSAWAVYKLRLPSPRNASTKSETPRILFSGVQPMRIPHVRRFFSHERSCPCHVDDNISLESILGRLRTGSSYSRLLRRETSSFLRRRPAYPYTTSGPYALLRGANGHDGTLKLRLSEVPQRSVIFLQDEVRWQIPIAAASGDF